jgi:hypothetical protein
MLRLRLIGPGLAAACWMAVVPVTVADDPFAMPDPTAQGAAAEMDARDLLGDRALPPDGTPEPGAPDSIMQGENAGFATMSTSSESHSSHESGKHHSSGSSFGIAFGMPDMTAGAAAMPVWLFQAGHHHHHGSNRGSSCTAPQNHQCRGCSIACPADQAAHCAQGDRGIFTEESSGICQREAKCECQ